MRESRATILIVDDEPINISLVAEVLSLKYRIKVATDGKSALEIANSSEKPDLILLDVVMPIIDGFEVATRLKTNPKTSNIPIIFLSIKQDNQATIRGFNIGAVDYITKPFSKEELCVRIDTHIKLDSLQKSLTKALQERDRQMAIMDKYILSSKTDTDGIITDISSAFCELTKYNKDELIGQKHSILKSGTIPQSIYETLWKTIKNEFVWCGELENLTKDKEKIWLETTISPEYDENHGLIGYVALYQNITDKKRIERLSKIDHLTKLYNRKNVEIFLQDELDRSARYDVPFSVIMVDIDHFKCVNDTFGHLVGDKMLIDVAKIFQANTRKPDIIGRFGGEEFVIVLPNTDIKSAKEVAEKLRVAIENFYFEDIGHKTASFGVSEYKKYDNINSIIKRADDGLYEAKNSGRNRVIIKE